MEKNYNNEKRLEFLISEALDEMELEDKVETAAVNFSESHKKKINKIIDKEKKKIVMKCFTKIALKVVAIFLLVIVILNFSVEGNRVKFLNYFIEYASKYTEIDYRNSDDSIGFRSESDICLEYIPKNFILKRKNENQNSIYVAFEKEDEYFTLLVNMNESVMRLDTENAIVETVLINDSEYMFVEKGGKISVYWTTRTKSFLLNGNISKQEIIKIIENIKSF